VLLVLILLLLLLLLAQVPHDRPVVAQKMLETWIESSKAATDSDFTPEAAQQARRHTAARKQQAQAATATV
jgi:hypothetical protein